VPICRRHMPITRSALGAMAAVLLLASCGSGGETGSAAAAAANEQLIAAAETGPYAVGLRTVQVDDPDRPGRTFPVDIWYPVEAADGAGIPAAEYSFIPGLGYTSEISLAEAPAAPGPFPLVIYSHGSGGFRWAATNHTEFLASRGFVVAAPDHPGNTALDAFTGANTDSPTNANNRPRDVSATIDAVIEASSTPGGPLAGRVDAERIAVTGHSFGGFTALAVASGHTNPLGSTTPDPRVDVVVTFAPYSLLLSDDELTAVGVPTLLISGTSDTTTPIATNTERPWELIAGRPLLRVDITGAPHNSFADVCQLQQKVGQIPDVPQAVVDELNRRAAEACGGEFLAFTEVQRLANGYTAAFLAAHLADDNGFDSLLACQSPPAEVSCSSKS
jgi:predicted dienelactone hydrolase